MIFLDYLAELTGAVVPVVPVVPVVELLTLITTAAATAAPMAMVAGAMPPTAAAVALPAPTDPSSAAPVSDSCGKVPKMPAGNWDKETNCEPLLPAVAENWPASTSRLLAALFTTMPPLCTPV